MRLHVWILWLAASAVLTSAGCGTRLRDYRCPPVVDASAASVEAAWSCNRKIIVHAIKGKGFSLREFRHAVAFFERVTGLPADVRPSEQGILPGPRLGQSLSAWDAWYREHGGAVVPGEGRR